MAQLKAGSTAGGEIIATRDWVTSTLIDGAPAALDTLNELAAAIGDNASYAASITTALAGKLGSTETAVNADKVDGYHASSLWRSDGGTWNPSANISLNQSANSQEWSFDIRRNGYTGGYWQVWDSANSTMLKVDAVSGKVSAPYGFVGDLTGNITGSAASATTAGSATTATTATNLGPDYTADDWFRATGDNNHVKFYGNSRQMLWRTDGTTEAYSGLGGYPFVWNYNGSGSGNRLMILHSNGRLWTSNYGWLDDKFQIAGTVASHEHAYIRTVSGTQAGDDCMPSTGYALQHFLGQGPEGNDGHIIGMTWTGTDIYGAQIWVDTDPNNKMAFRSRSNAGVWTGWNNLWHDGNFNPASYLTTSGKAADSNLLDGQDSSGFFRNISGIAGADKDALTGNGFLSASYSGYSSQIWTVNSGGSTGTVQMEFEYNTPSRGFKVRNKTDNNSWSSTGWVVMTTANQGHISGTIWHSGNFNPANYLGATSKAADSNLLDGINSTSFLRSDQADSMSGVLTLTNSSGASRLRIEGTTPTIDLDDSDGDSFYIHVNSNNFYVLVDRDGNGNYGDWDGAHPLQLEGDTNSAYIFGNKINSAAFAATSAFDSAGSAAAAQANAIATVNDRIDAEVIPAIPNAFVSATVDNDTITFTKADGTTQAVTTSDANTNTWRPIDDTPVNGVTDQSISSNWAYDHANATNPHGITLADLGYTGATNANYITNNNQLTNGAGYLTASNDRVYITDSRGAVRAPSYYNDRYAQWDFQNESDTGITAGDTWQVLLTVSKWASYHDSHRQEQLIFTGDNLYRRTATSDSEWGESKKIWDSGNFDPGTIPTNNSQLTNGAGYITSASLPGSFSGTSAGLVPESTIPSAERSKYFMRSDGNWTDIMTTINGKAASSHTHGIGSIVDPYRWWNNFGDNHTTRTSFDAEGGALSTGFGWRYIQGSGNGPGTSTSPNQYYGVTVGLGNDYNYDQYGMQLVIPRNTATPYISVRFEENRVLGPWQKISAGYADSAGSVSWDNVSGKPSLASLNGSASQDFYVDDLYYDAWIRNHSNNNGLYWNNTGWHLYPKDGDDFLFRSGSTGSAAMRFMTSGTERNYLYCNSSNEVGFLDTGRSWIFRVYNNGNVVANGDITAYSDARLKENVKPIEGALDKVMKLQGVTYTRNDSEDKSTKIGFIAQEVKEVVPEVVSISPDELAGLDDRHSLDYGKMVALLTEALKDQQKQIEELKAKLDGLTN